MLRLEPYNNRKIEGCRILSELKELGQAMLDHHITIENGRITLTPKYYEDKARILKHPDDNKNLMKYTLHSLDLMDYKCLTYKTRTLVIQGAQGSLRYWHCPIAHIGAYYHWWSSYDFLKLAAQKLTNAINEPCRYMLGIRNYEGKLVTEGRVPVHLRKLDHGNTWPILYPDNDRTRVSLGTERALELLHV